MKTKKKFPGEEADLGTGTKSALCRGCGTVFTSPTAFTLHQDWDYNRTPSLKCASTEEELHGLGLVLGKRGRWTMDPEGNWWDQVKKANTMFDEEDEAED